MTEAKRVRLNKTGIGLHALSVGIVLVFIALAFIRFEKVFDRTLASMKDFATSFVYFFAALIGMKGEIHPTVNDIPKKAVEVLPFDPYVFSDKLKEFGRALISKERIAAYMQMLTSKGTVVLGVAIPIAIIVLLIWGVSKLKKKAQNNHYNEDTLPLRIYKTVELFTWVYVKKFASLYIGFLSVHKWYLLAFGLVWAYNLNLITIALEIIAYALYLPFSLDFLHLYTLIAKVAMDLTVAIDFLPWFVWVIVGYFFFDWWRKEQALKVLYRYEDRNRVFLENHPGALFIVGKQRSEKTKMMTDMALSQEQIFRDTAFNGMMRHAKQFPYFPWVNLQNFYRTAYMLHSLPTLESHRRFMRKLYLHFKYRDRYAGTFMEEFLHYWYTLRYGYDYEDFIFEYDFARYGIEYDDGLTMVHVFEALEAYVQQLYIYAAPTPLIFGNYSIRTDIVWQDTGNLMVYNGDFFRRKSKDVEEISQYSHIGIEDSMRLGKLNDENNPYKDAAEVGVWVKTEWAKERGNQITNRIYSEKNQDEEDWEKCTPLNDGFEVNVKMKGHEATIDYDNYFRLFGDDQRPGSLGAENKDLCDVVRIEGVSNKKVVLPFFFVEQIVNFFAEKIYDKQYIDEAVRRGDNTLWGYLRKKICTPIFHHYERLKKQYCAHTIPLRVWDGGTDEVINGKSVYYVCEGKAHRKRYATDAIKPWYSKKAARSMFGLNDVPQFRNVHMTTEEMQMIGSHFYKRLDKVFGVKREKAEEGTQAA